MTPEPIEAVIARAHKFLETWEAAAQIAGQHIMSAFGEPLSRSDFSRLLDYVEGMRWRPIERAPKDGSAFLAYGVHDRDAPAGASREVKAGDHWWGIILWDVWRGAPKFVFSKDGAATWSEPTHWQPLLPPPPVKGGDA